MTVWKLQAGREKRIRGGHPWVFSNELTGSPKGVTPGQIVELQDMRGDFVARGYAHPSTLICFRVLTRDSSEVNPYSTEFLIKRLETAARLRVACGFGGSSFRLVFGESDLLPGLIVDRFLTPRGTVLVTQAHTAGAQKLQEIFFEVAGRISAYLDQLENSGSRPHMVIVRNDVRFRELEGLSLEGPRALGTEISSEDLKVIDIFVRSASPFARDAIPFSVNLWDGQKTGFFLDQASNIRSLLSLVNEAWIRGAPTSKVGNSPLKVLDLCCFVGQWSTQIAQHLKAQGASAQFHLVDASASALEFAAKNVNQILPGSAVPLKRDVMNELSDFATDYDIVICDPPALIKSRKDLGPGTQAYAKLNGLALARLRDGGFFISCSCSGLLTEEDFQQAISKAMRKSQRSVAWLQRGSPSADHPVRFEFPEGKYLKCWIGLAHR